MNFTKNDKLLMQSLTVFNDLLAMEKKELIIITGYPELMRGTGLTIMQARHSLKKLIQAGMVEKLDSSKGLTLMLSRDKSYHDKSITKDDSKINDLPDDDKSYHQNLSSNYHHDKKYHEKVSRDKPVFQSISLKINGLQVYLDSSKVTGYHARADIYKYNIYNNIYIYNIINTNNIYIIKPSDKPAKVITTPKPEKSVDCQKKSGNLSPKDLTELSIEDAAEFMAYRKAKKAPLTATAWKRIVNEAYLAGMTPKDATAEIQARGWTGFKAEWMINTKRAGNETNRTIYADNSAVGKVKQAIAARYNEQQQPEKIIGNGSTEVFGNTGKLDSHVRDNSGPMGQNDGNIRPQMDIKLWY